MQGKDDLVEAVGGNNTQSEDGGLTGEGVEETQELTHPRVGPRVGELNVHAPGARREQCHLNVYAGHSMLSIAFVQTINLGDTFWISEIRFQYPGSSSEDNKAIDYMFGICHFHVFLSTCYEY